MILEKPNFINGRMAKIHYQTHGTILPFAKSRHSFEDGDFRDHWSTNLQYHCARTLFELKMHRITCKDTMELKSSVHYAEVLCANKYLKEIGPNYLNLFKGILVH